MNFKNTIIILSLLALSGYGALKEITHPDRKDIVASRVHLVDRYAVNGSNNFLFRGGDPVLSSNEFAYDELVTLMRSAAEEKGVALPDDFYLIDFSLLFVERADLSVERNYFQKNPEKGEFVNYPVFGHVGGSRFERVVKIAEKDVDLLGKLFHYQIFGALDRILKITEKADDKLAHLDIQAVTGLRGLITDKRDKPVVIYVHCLAGCDRTGEIIGAYRMQYMEQDIQTVFDMNSAECERQENQFSRDSLEVYCSYLGMKDCVIN